jgi:hypothetical protein
MLLQILRVRRGDRAEALAAFRAAVACKPQFAQAHQRLGLSPADRARLAALLTGQAEGK